MKLKTNQQHPITPPPELVREWLGAHFDTTVTGEVSDVELFLAAQAYRAGADQELEACCEWVSRFNYDDYNYGDELRTARRPKPPSLKEQALAALAAADGADHPVVATVITADQHDIIRRALEALPE